jgi:hypothetical protein
LAPLPFAPDQSGRRKPRSGAGDTIFRHPQAAGLLYSAGDVATKAAVSGTSPVLLFAALLLACHGLAFVSLQLSFQRGTALATAGVSTLLTNMLPILAGLTIFAEHMPGGAAGTFADSASPARCSAVQCSPPPDARAKPLSPGEALPLSGPSRAGASGEAGAARASVHRFDGTGAQRLALLAAAIGPSAGRVAARRPRRSWRPSLAPCHPV